MNNNYVCWILCLLLVLTGSLCLVAPHSHALAGQNQTHSHRNHDTHNQNHESSNSDSQSRIDCCSDITRAIPNQTFQKTVVDKPFTVDSSSSEFVVKTEVLSDLTTDSIQKNKLRFRVRPPSPQFSLRSDRINAPPVR
jgi:hypothetical protein